ncbi:CPBP family intramembrane glutamic endopeptidase [Stratiformator vulcanicus]|uniref:CAAX amino terminal protease self-immunity n=1 Tax=Stratiformator vulcanicus TaxID=2527980 RepID=A0A517R3Q8_9PLAN|nr:CPBP family intramembrane glutamic endopeptidase [Stratiformator vulcanicus]QDT38487.1 CAAX amino terminal protease self- immunity [Stratiformator vulcanicus]
MSRRDRFLLFAAGFETALAILAVILGLLFRINPAGTLRFDWYAIGWGLGAVAPALLLFGMVDSLPLEPLRRIRRLLHTTLGQTFAACHPLELLVLAALAGIGEELLFRGFFQVWLGQWGYWTGIIGASVLFGLAHAVTPTYAVLAALMGLYFGFLFDLQDPPNVLIPILTHAIYDWIAFLWIAREVRRESAEYDRVGDET